MFVKAFDSEEAMGIASLLVKPYDMIVKFVDAPGSEAYGEEDISDADPLPVMETAFFSTTGGVTPNKRIF
jgi:hypothetical protein